MGTVRSVMNEATPPLALALLAACLRHQGYRVTAIDAIGMGLNRSWDWNGRENYRCQGATFEEILDAVPEDADLLAFSCMFSGEWPLNRALIHEVRKKYPHVPIVAGGEHITALPEFSLRDCSSLDFVATGEGEGVLVGLCEALRRTENGVDVRGIKYLDASGTYVDTGTFPRLTKIDEIPWPAWDLVQLEPYWDNRKSHGLSTLRDMPLMVSRGCPYRCTFCSSPQMWTTRYVLRDVDDVLDEIQLYIDRYGITSIQFYDLTAITKKSWTIEFCTKMLERGIRINWSLPSGTRSEVLDEEVLALLARTNCSYLVYAPESGSPETLKIIKKRIKLDRVTHSVKTAVANGLVLRINLLIGFPHETRKQILETLRYGWKLIMAGADEAVANLFSPYPGSELFRELHSKNQVVLNDDYFYSLTSLNGDYSDFNPPTFSRHIGSRELAFYRLFSMVSNYVLSYVLYPKRVIRLAKGFSRPGNSATLFEQRLQEIFRQWRNRARSG